MDRPTNGIHAWDSRVISRLVELHLQITSLRCGLPAPPPARCERNLAHPPPPARSFDGLRAVISRLRLSSLIGTAGRFQCVAAIYVTTKCFLDSGGFTQHFFYDDAAGDGNHYFKKLPAYRGWVLASWRFRPHGKWSFTTAITTNSENTLIDFESPIAAVHSDANIIYKWIGIAQPRLPGHSRGPALPLPKLYCTLSRPSAGNLAARATSVSYLVLMRLRERLPPRHHNPHDLHKRINP